MLIGAPRSFGRGGAAVSGAPRRSARFALGGLLALELRLLRLVELGVGVDDAADEGVAHDVVAGEAGEVDVVDVVEHARDELQAAGAGRAGRPG